MAPQVWHRINDLFNWLPLAANIEGKILCMHGGIGRCINTIQQIADLQRPITMETGGQVGTKEGVTIYIFHYGAASLF